MARVTVEDCLSKVRNRFELVLAAAQRTKQLIHSGIEPIVPWENDKATVVALREIASGLLEQAALEEVEVKDVRSDYLNMGINKEQNEQNIKE